jgi:hypothetical protein
VPLKLSAVYRQPDGNWSAWHPVPERACASKVERFVLARATDFHVGLGVYHPAFHLLCQSIAGKLTHAMAIALTPELWLSGNEWTDGGDVHHPVNAGPLESIVDVGAGGRLDDRDQRLLHVAVVTSTGELRHCVRRANGEWTKFAQLPRDVWDPQIRAARVSQYESTAFVMPTDGRMRGMYREVDGNWFRAYSPGWGSDNAGGTPHRSMSAVYEEGGTVRQFAAVDATGQLLHAWRSSQQSTPWRDVTAPGAAGGTGSHWQGTATSVSCQLHEGELHLCATNSTGHVCHSLRATGPAASWSPLRRIPGSEGLGSPVRHVSCAMGKDGWLMVVAGVER